MEQLKLRNDSNGTVLVVAPGGSNGGTRSGRFCSGVRSTGAHCTTGVNEHRHVLNQRTSTRRLHDQTKGLGLIGQEELQMEEGVGWRGDDGGAMTFTRWIHFPLSTCPDNVPLARHWNVSGLSLECETLTGASDKTEVSCQRVSPDAVRPTHDL